MAGRFFKQMIPGVEVVEKDAIKRLVGHELVSSYPEVFEDGVKRDLNFHILMQAIHRNQKERCRSLASSS